jgi:hypothetical protein
MCSVPVPEALDSCAFTSKSNDFGPVKVQESKADVRATLGAEHDKPGTPDGTSMIMGRESVTVIWRVAVFTLIHPLDRVTPVPEYCGGPIVTEPVGQVPQVPPEAALQH